MATLSEAIAAGALDLFEIPEWENRAPIRPLYVTQGFIDWADGTPELHDEGLKEGGRTLFEHLEQQLTAFRCDKKIHAGDLRRMMPTKKGVWHMYPPGLRIYGWCPAKHEFVAVTGALEADTKKPENSQLNDQKRKEVEGFIGAHRLQGTVLRGDFLAVFPNQAL
ncbi:MAG: hypothetical protein HYR63_14045 [Proteobacteria bacterium]|nr:hypothetical protein [Pseudomonadota bacterium]